MLRQSKFLVALSLFLCLLQKQANADILQFCWIDNEGQAGEFVLDTTLGFTSGAISDFSYVLENGSPTPPDFQVNNFISFANGSAFDINVGAEGLSFGFASSVDPLPSDPQFYEDQFVSFSFITNSGTRSASSIAVKAVPEPSGLPVSILASIYALKRRRTFLKKRPVATN